MISGKELLMIYTRPDGYSGDTATAVMYYDRNSGRLYESTQYGLIDFYGNSFPDFGSAIAKLRQSMADRPNYFGNVTALKDGIVVINNRRKR